MSDLVLVHRPFSNQNGEENNPLLVWKTCLRQIFFFDQSAPEDFRFSEKDEIFAGAEAEAFLAEILCGLKSPLIGETEVFGQFKNWWKSVPDHEVWKKRHQGRIETLFSLVKSVREKVLCGQGSQSYGSLLRRHLKESATVDILGAGHLVQEMAPWIQKKAEYRIWSRSPQKISETSYGKAARQLLPFHVKTELFSVVVVAAPLSHQELNVWLKERGFSKHHTLFDFRSDSSSFVPFVEPSLHLKLAHFSSEHEEHRNEIERKARQAKEMILQWKDQQVSKVQVRPYGWDDL